MDDLIEVLRKTSRAHLTACVKLQRLRNSVNPNSSLIARQIELCRKLSAQRDEAEAEFMQTRR